MNFSEPEGLVQYTHIRHLYKEAFPRSERKPFHIIRKMHKKGKTDIWYFSQGKDFIGFAATINSDTTVLIDYFAVNGRKRGQGYGTEMLKTLLKHYDSRGVFLEIEIAYESADNYTERLRRKNFYINAGFTPMNTRAKLFGVDMELLGVNCHLDFEQYRSFYLVNYGKFAYDHIEKIDK